MTLGSEIAFEMLKALQQEAPLGFRGRVVGVYREAYLRLSRPQKSNHSIKVLLVHTDRDMRQQELADLLGCSPASETNLSGTTV